MMTVITPAVAEGVHPWVPAEGEFAEKVAPRIAKHVRLLEQCVTIGNDLIDRAQGCGDPSVYRVHITLLVRILQDVRACLLCTRAGYTMQAWTIAGSAYEAAHTIGYVGRDRGRAEQWLEHESLEKSGPTVYLLVANTVEFLGIEPDPTARRAVVDESYKIYRHLCMAKHVNPIAERDRYIFSVHGRPNLILSPLFTGRRAAEARLGLLLSLRSAHIALWAFDVTHLADPGLVDTRVADIAVQIGEMAGLANDDLLEASSHAED